MVMPGMIVLPVLAHVWLVMILYVYLGISRKQAVKSGEMKYEEFTPTLKEPLAVARLSRNLSNQFELPVIFYLLSILLLLSQRATMTDIYIAWAFVASRVVHSGVALFSNRIRPRSLAFAVGLLLILALAARVMSFVLT